MKSLPCKSLAVNPKCWYHLRSIETIRKLFAIQIKLAALYQSVIHPVYQATFYEGMKTLSRSQEKDHVAAAAVAGSLCLALKANPCSKSWLPAVSRLLPLQNRFDYCTGGIFSSSSKSPSDEDVHASENWSGKADLDLAV